MKIDHIGVAVESIDKALPFYRKLGLEPGHREEVSSQKVRVAFLQAGEASIELLEPLGGEGPIAKFLQTRGPGLHHLAFATDDIKAEMSRLSAGGTPPLESDPRLGARGHKVCFIHHKHASGVLVELVQHG